jgi:aminoglycoside 6'-N-acetyltransferase
VTQFIEFRALSERDFPMLERWLAEPHARRFYQKTPVMLDVIVAKYGPVVSGEDSTLCDLALFGGTPYAYLQC